MILTILYLLFTSGLMISPTTLVVLIITDVIAAQSISELVQHKAKA